MPTREQYEAAIRLAAEDVAFFNYENPLEKDIVCVYLLCNDVFSYASADAELVPWENVCEVEQL